MKCKLIITCVCLGMLGSTVACAADEEATTETTESASPQSENDKGQDSAAKSAKSDDSSGNTLANAKERAIKALKIRGRAQMTHADCFPKSAPDSAPSNAKTCVSLANSAPDMAFSKNDYDNMPEECKPLVPPKCR